jgi:hypothetical protein
MSQEIPVVDILPVCVWYAPMMVPVHYRLTIARAAFFSASRHLLAALSTICTHSWQSRTDVARRETASPPRG